MKVLMLPYPKPGHQGTSGIDRVVEAYHRHLPEFGVELVHPDADSYDLLAVHAGLTADICDVCHCHGLHWTADYRAAKWEYEVNARVIGAVRHARRVTVPSAWVAETFQRDMRFTPDVIPHGIDWDGWQHDEPLGDYVLWNKNRGDDVCDPTPVLELATRFMDTHFVTTFLPRGLERPHKVSVIGRVPFDQMRKLVQSALVYLATTKETFGIGILEAMASGVPVLGYRHGGAAALVEHGVSGYLAQPGDVDDLAAGLAYCLKHRRVLGANGRELARAWTWEAACEKVAEVYRAALVDEPPTVGVVIPVYNKTGEEIRRAVLSTANQTYFVAGRQNRENSIVIVDDGSDEGTGHTIDRVVSEVGSMHTHTNISVVRQHNQGVAVARNRGISGLSSKYVACLDADDWLEPDFLKVCVDALETDQSLGIAYTGLRYHKPGGETGVSPWPGDWNFDRQLERQNQVPTACVFRREMWQRLGGYRQRYAPQGAGAEDAEFWLRAGAYGWKAAKVTEEALFNYSWMSGQVTGNPDYKEIDWTVWAPWARDRQHPFASYATPHFLSHPVRQYDEPLVSVVIPVGPGHERSLIDALDSLEAQTFRKWEAIVVWDSPNTDPIISERHTVKGVETAGLDWLPKSYPYVKLVLQPGLGFGANGFKPLGAGVARNRGAEVARAPFLLFLDADDWLYDRAAIQKMVDAWNGTESIPYGDYVGRAFIDDPAEVNKLDDRGRLISYDPRHGEALVRYQAFDFDCERVMRQPELPNPYVFCLISALVPRAWHDEIGGFDERMPSWEDVDYHWRLARAGHCYHRIAEPLILYRFYTGNRREAGLQEHQNLVKYLQDKYEEEAPMGCRSCGGNSRRSTTPTVQSTIFPQAGAMAAPAGGHVDGLQDSDFVLCKYVLNKRGDHPVIGSNAINPLTNRKFHYGMRSGGDVFLVHKDDVWMVDRRTGQLVLRDPSRFQPTHEGTPQPPPEPPRETPAPVAIVEEMEVREIAAVPKEASPGHTTITIRTDDGISNEEANAAAEVLLQHRREKASFDFQTLPGVTPGIAAKLKSLGLEGPEDLLKFGEEGLMTIKGVGEVKARRIVEYLQK